MQTDITKWNWQAFDANFKLQNASTYIGLLPQRPQYQVFTMKEIRSEVCMAQAGPEIPRHVLSFMQEHPELRGETLVKVYEDRTEVLNAN